jgi:chemotaxis protein histidine kinase CheA
VTTWADDPELVATFRAEVEDRLASLRDGLLKLESHPSPRQLVGVLFRDAHTVKGSARMLGLGAVVDVAHRSEDLLGALRDGRFQVRTDLVDVLLVAAEAIGRALPGSAATLAREDLPAVVAALDAACDGVEPVEVPKLGARRDLDDAESDADGDRPRGGGSIRVPTRRVHDLVDVLGEAELDVRRISRHGRELATLAADHLRAARALRGSLESADPALLAAAHGLVALGDQLNAATRELQTRAEDAQYRLAAVRDGAMGLAMVPVRRVVAGFPQLVRELAAGADAPKDVQLVLEGPDVELDTRVLDAVADSLKHLVTNAVDHGCEPVAVRQAAGKPGRATVTLRARAAGSTVVIEVSDDGRGIDEDLLRVAAVDNGLLPADSTLSGPALLNVVFAPHFSTREEVTQTSGRGVGLDVVRTVIEELSGSIEVRSTPGEGTTFTMTLPVTLGVLRCLIARVGDERYALPVTAVVETLLLPGVERSEVAGVPVIARDGRTMPIVDLGDAVAAPGERNPRAAVVVSHGGAGEVLAFAVDQVEGEREVVVKELGAFLGRLPSVAGATIDGDGSVVLVLDVRDLAVRQAGGAGAPAAVARAAAPPAVGLPGARRSPEDRPAPGQRPRVLVVEDSVGVRELQRVILEGAGYEVLTAVDGLDGASRLRGDPVDLVISDVEMPGMDGFTLTRSLRKTRGWEDVPVVIMTSRGDDADQRAGLDAGASAYLLKSRFDQAELIDTVRRLIGR